MNVAFLLKLRLMRLLQRFHLARRRRGAGFRIRLGFFQTFDPLPHGIRRRDFDFIADRRFPRGRRLLQIHQSSCMIVALLRQRGLKHRGGGLGLGLGGVRILDALVRGALHLLQTALALFEFCSRRRFRRLHGLLSDRLLPLRRVFFHAVNHSRGTGGRLMGGGEFRANRSERLVVRLFHSGNTLGVLDVGRAADYRRCRSASA
jgi:hypothetical protein